MGREVCRPGIHAELPLVGLHGLDDAGDAELEVPLRTVQSTSAEISMLEIS